MQGALAYKSKVNFPEDKDVLGRSVIVGEMNPAVTLEQVCCRSQFTGCCQVIQKSYQICYGMHLKVRYDLMQVSKLLLLLLHPSSGSPAQHMNTLDVPLRGHALCRGQF